MKPIHKILILILITLLSISNASAAIHHQEEYSITYNVKDTYISCGSSAAATDYTFYWWASISDNYPTYSNTWYIKVYSPQSTLIYTSPLIHMDYHPKTKTYSNIHHGVVGSAISPLGKIFFDFNSGSGNCYGRWDLTVIEGSRHNISGVLCGVNTITMWINNSGTWLKLFENDVIGETQYDYKIYNTHQYKIVFNSYEHVFTCDGNKVFDGDLCHYIYGNTCGIKNISLFNNSVGWILEQQDSLNFEGDSYKMLIEDGEDYKINFHNLTHLSHTYLFSCVGNSIKYDYLIYIPSENEENFNDLFDSPDTWSYISVIFGTYENTLGKSLFWLIIILIPFTMTWIKQQSVIIPSVLALICGSTLFVLLPVESVAAVKILLVVGISGIIYHILKAR